MTRLAESWSRTLNIRAINPDARVVELSGGNQQKVVIGKWLATLPKVIILDEPTKGIDIGSKAAVHAFMSQLAVEGLAVIMVSSEIPEILGMSDRVIVMREGRMAGVFEREGLSPEALVRAAGTDALPQIELPALRRDPAAKRALWPRLRSMRAAVRAR